VPLISPHPAHYQGGMVRANPGDGTIDVSGNPNELES